MPPLSSTLPKEPLLRAGLWNYLREDITFSLINECPLKVDVGRVKLELSRDDDYANQITLLLTRVINAVFVGREEFPGELKVALVDWRNHLPFQAYHESDEGVFPRIQMVHDSHGKSCQTIRRLALTCVVAAIQYWHVASILLACQKDPDSENEAHARAICGMAFSASSDSVVVNSYGPICYSKFSRNTGGQELTRVGARWLKRDEDRRELVNRLLDSQKRTGWPVQTIIRQLKHCWTRKEKR